MDKNTSISSLKDRLNKDINDIEAALTLGNIYYDNENPSQSIVYYRHALEINPAMPGALTDMGAMYWRNDDIGLAEKAFRDAIAQDSGFGYAYVNLGMLLKLAKNNVLEARSVWQKLIAINPDHAVADKARELLKETATAIY